MVRNVNLTISYFFECVLFCSIMWYRCDQSCRCPLRTGCLIHTQTRWPMLTKPFTYRACANKIPVSLWEAQIAQIQYKSRLLVSRLWKFSPDWAKNLGISVVTSPWGSHDNKHYKHFMCWEIRSNISTQTWNKQMDQMDSILLIFSAWVDISTAQSYFAG